MIKTKERHQYLHRLRMRIIILIEVGRLRFKKSLLIKKMQRKKNIYWEKELKPEQNTGNLLYK